MEKAVRKFCKSEVLDVDEKGRVKVGANAFGNEDSDGDISQKGSYTKTIQENFDRVKWFLNHDETILLGVPIEAQQTKRLEVLGQLNMKKQVSIDTYEDYKLYAEYGKTLEHSVKVQAVKRDPTDRRVVLEWKWWEYSTLTSWGANSDTPLMEIKNFKELFDGIEWMETMLKKGKYTDERCIAIEKQLSILRSLCDEPDASTRLIEPNEKSEEIKPVQLDELLVMELKSINQLFN